MGRVIRYMPIAAALMMIILLVLAVWFGPTLSGGELFIPQPTAGEMEISTSRIDILLQGIDQIVSMLMTIGFGLFVLIGAPMQVTIGRKRALLADEIFAACGFAIFVFVSIYFGFIARTQAFELANFGHDDFMPLLNIIGWQAFGVALASICAFYFAICAFVRNFGVNKK